MARKRRRLRKLVVELARRFPDLENPGAVIDAGDVLVDGYPNRNPASLVPVGVPLALRAPKELRGEVKLRHALRAFEIQVASRVALDLGSAAGGFTRVLLESGAARVYAVDAGHGQLLGSLRQDPRVVNLERTNLGALTTALVPERVEVITLDLSYLPVAAAVTQLEVLRIAPGADLVALVKPIYELRLGALPTDEAQHRAAVAHAGAGLRRNGWRVLAADRSPAAGARGAVEWLLHACRETRVP